MLAGCSTMSSMNPINWWHRQEGGKIAQDRPAPPGADQPYPNISTVPAKPEPADQDALKKLTDSLVADRTNAQHAAQAAPLADPSSPAASPNLFGVGTAPPPPPPGVAPVAGKAPAGPASAGSPATGGSVASASMPAVTAPPPSPAPRKAVESTPLEAPSAGQAAPGSAPGTAAGQTTAGQASQATSAPAASSGGAPPAATDVTQAGPSPTLPAGPPARPAVAGPAPVAPVLPAPMPASSTGPAATIVFVERASDLSQPATDEVKAFGAKRGKGTISVTGYGDATSSDPEAQSSALTLGLSRAQSVVDALKAAGVPGNAIRVSAEASGRGALLQLLQ